MARELRVRPDEQALARLTQIDRIEAEDHSPLGSWPAQIIDLALPRAEEAAHALSHVGMTGLLGIDLAGDLPPVDPDHFDMMLTIRPGAPAPWVSLRADRIESEAESILQAVYRTPVTATSLCRILRMNGNMPFRDAVALESFAYSALLGGSEFGHWNCMRGPEGSLQTNPFPVEVEREADHLTITLADRASGNGMSAIMRDALFNALVGALEDPTCPRVSLLGKGRCFSTGGVLGEFGTARDLAQAHIIRTTRSCALLLHELGDRADVVLNGACIGSGLEVPVAAAIRRATSDAWFQLPEVKMGLIPGAGGTVSITRAIGRQRACYMMLSGRRISAKAGLDWGLVQELV
ncbi:enoyl-CoA hydratase/isomerase family protein [Sphingobium sp. SCG-1]|uniref:enoyl-CoA hydratase/isomerase family protein n=1 Tax=Sphingobium sp. SCG-1 TaxID=2072936 RepID=UPI001670863B|nr:enoyl-CoA hydratase/isomerase family protein [Sphingobium sp. SCG-1]